MMILKDDSLLDYGKAHRGKALIDVPADYLIWIFENCSLPANLYHYIKENMDVLKAQANQKHEIKERKNFCPACNAEKQGIRSRVAYKHTCGLDGPIKNKTT